MANATVIPVCRAAVVVNQIGNVKALAISLRQEHGMNYAREKARVNLLAIIEAATVTGPAKNLLAFCETARRSAFSGLPEVETTIATFLRQSTAAAGNEFVTRARQRGIECRVIEERRRFDLQVVVGLQRLAAESNPDIIQTHNVKSHFLMRLSGLANRHRWIAFHHGYTTTDAKMRAYNQLDRWSLKAAARVVTMSQAFARQLENLGVATERIRVLHNAVDVEAVASVSEEAAATLRERLNIAASERVVLAIGRLSQEKGHKDLLAAFARLVKQDAALPVRLVIVGEGPEDRRLAEASAAAGLADRVIFAGQVANVREYYAMADVLVLPSHSEGSPNVLLEAMAAGVPVVATAVGGVPEIVTPEETALLVKARDTEALAQAMKRLLNDRGLAEQLAERARLQVTARHTPTARLRSLLELYAELMPERASAHGQVV